MTYNIIDGFAAPTRAIKAYLTAERVEGGFLEDIETLKVGQKSTEPVDTPCVWMVKHPTVPNDAGKGNLSQTMMMKLSVEFVCIEYDPDPETAAAKAENLATRVVASILKNFNLVKSQPDDPNRIFQFIHFNEFIPDGEVDVAGKSESVPCSSVILDFIFPINWLKCKTI